MTEDPEQRQIIFHAWYCYLLINLYTFVQQNFFMNANSWIFGILKTTARYMDNRKYIPQKHVLHFTENKFCMHFTTNNISGQRVNRHWSVHVKYNHKSRTNCSCWKPNLQCFCFEFISVQRGHHPHFFVSQNSFEPVALVLVLDIMKGIWAFVSNIWGYLFCWISASVERDNHCQLWVCSLESGYLGDSSNHHSWPLDWTLSLQQAAKWKNTPLLKRSLCKNFLVWCWD